MARVVMLLGTCRVHEPTLHMRSEYKIPAWRTSHRLHTPMQTLQFVRHMCGEQVYDERNIHLLSDHAIQSIMTGRRTPTALLAELDRLKGDWERVECFVIEISSLREFAYELAPDKRFYVNTFCRRDLELHAAALEEKISADQAVAVRASDITLSILSPRQTAEVMAEIAERLKRPILWVSHIRPGSQAAEFETVNAVRKRVADSVSEGARRLRQQFIDPTDELLRFGRAQFLTKNGADLDHLTEFGARHMAGVYQRFVASVRTR